MQSHLQYRNPSFPVESYSLHQWHHQFDPRDHQEAGTGVNKPISLASVDQLNLNSKQERTGDRGATEGRHDWKLKEQLGNVKGFLKRSHQKSFASTQGKKKFNKKKEKKHRKKRHKHRRGKDNVDQGRKDGKLVSSMHLTEHKLKRTTTVYQDGVWPCQKGHTIAEHIDAVDNLQTAYMEKSFLERIRNIIFCILSGSLFERNMHSTTGSGIRTDRVSPTIIMLGSVMYGLKIAYCLFLLIVGTVHLEDCDDSLIVFLLSTSAVNVLGSALFCFFHFNHKYARLLLIAIQIAHIALLSFGSAKFAEGRPWEHAYPDRDTPVKFCERETYLFVIMTIGVLAFDLTVLTVYLVFDCSLHAKRALVSDNWTDRLNAFVPSWSKLKRKRAPSPAI